MKVIFLNGLSHGRVLEVELPAGLMAAPVLCDKRDQPLKVYLRGGDTQSEPELYYLHSSFVTRQKTIVAIYTTRPFSFVLMEQVFDLASLILYRDELVGLAIWQEREMQCRLMFDADLRKSLIVARVTFENEIAQIQARNTINRAKCPNLTQSAVSEI